MRGRGQLLLVGALLLATAVIAIALILNTVIFTENLATRDRANAIDGPREFRGLATDATADGIEHVNRANNTSHAALRSNLTTYLGDWTRASARQRASDGVAVNVSVVETTAGTRVMQSNGSRNFTAGDAEVGDGNWTLSEGHRVRQFRLNVSRDSLYNLGTIDELTDTNNETITENAFHVVADDGTPARVYLFRDDDDDVRLLVEQGGTYAGGNDPDCQSDDSWVTVDLVNATVDGQACSALETLGPVLADSPDVAYENATLGDDDRAAGRYDLLVKGNVSRSDPYYDAGSGQSPFTTPALFSATVRVTYQESGTRHETVEYVVP